MAMLNSPQQSASSLQQEPPSVLPQPLKDTAATHSNATASNDELTLEQQVLLVSLEDDPQLQSFLQIQPISQETEAKEIKEMITIKETPKDTIKDIKPKNRAGSISARSKEAFTAISKRFSPPPSRSQSTSTPSTPVPTTSSCSTQYEDTPGATGSIESNGSSTSVSHSSLSHTGSTSLPVSHFKDHSRHHTDPATFIPAQYNRRSRSSISSCSVSSSCCTATNTTSPSSCCTATNTTSPSSSIFFSPAAFYTSLFSPKHSTGCHNHSHTQNHCSTVNPLSPTSSLNSFSCVTPAATTTTRTTYSGVTMTSRASFSEPGSKPLQLPDADSIQGSAPISRQTRSASCTRLFPMSSSPSFSSLTTMLPSTCSLDAGIPVNKEDIYPESLEPSLSVPGHNPGSETAPMEEDQTSLAQGLYPSQASITTFKTNPDSSSPTLSSTSTNPKTLLVMPMTNTTTSTTALDRRPSPTFSTSPFLPTPSPSLPSSALFPSTSISSSSTTASSSTLSMLPPLPLFPPLPLGSFQNHPHHPHLPNLPYLDDSRDSSSSSSSSSLPLSLSHTFASTTIPHTTSSSLSTTATSTSSTAITAPIMGASSPVLYSQSHGTTPTGNNACLIGNGMTTCHSHTHVHSHSHHPFAHPPPPQGNVNGLSFEASVQGLELSLPGKVSAAVPIVDNNGTRSLLPPASPMSSSFNSDSGFPAGSRRSSKDSVDSVPGVTLDVLVNQLTIPDYNNSIEQIARTKVFLMIYRRFLRPRELLEMFIERFEDLGEFVDDDDEQAKNTRLRICLCLQYWLKNHPNDLIHRQTRQRLASFLRERVALFPCLSEIYSKLLPLSSIHYFNTWRWPQAEHNADWRNSSYSGTTASGSASDEDSDSGFYDAATATHSEHDMDEDREWGLFDEDEVAPDTRVSLVMESLIAPFSPSSFGTGNIGVNLGSSNGNRLQAPSFNQLPRDRRSSTGSLAHHNSPCGMEAFVANRRGSASSVSSSQSHTPSGLLGHSSTNSFAEGYMTPLQLQPMTSIPFINKRSSSQAYRQKVAQQQHQQQRNVSPVPPIQGTTNNGSNGILVYKETADEPIGAGGVHPLQGKASPLPPPPVDYLSINMSFLEIPDGAIAAQLTSIEFLLFRKLKILRDMGNFNTTMAMIAAMNSSAIHRLTQTRELLQGKEIWNTFKELEHLMSTERSFHEYRCALKVQRLPCIPYLGVHLGDLLSISEGNKDFRQDGSIHWQKFCLLTEVISTVMHFQSEPYLIQPDPFISRAITDTHVLDEDELYNKSV
ncbi:hypothetical protein FBU30_010025, partial [Linnemannia zychae]